MTRKRGFTLIELLLSITVLAILGTYAWLSINASFQSQKAVERFARMQEMGSAVISKMTLDLSQAFIIPSNQNLTFFKGEESSIEFTSLSRAPLRPDTKESEQTEITYKVENNPNQRGLSYLMRNETRFIDGPIENREEEAFEILTGNLESLLFEYSKDGRQYFKEWNTTEADRRDQLPNLIRLSLSLVDHTDPNNLREASFSTYIDLPLSDFAGLTQQAQQNPNQDGSDPQDDPNTPPNQPGVNPNPVPNTPPGAP